MPKNIQDDLKNLLKRASEKAVATKKQAEEVSTALDSANDHTTPVSTGAQAAAVKSEQSQTYAAPAVDAGAQTNQANASVTNSPQGAAAGAPSGDAGAKAPGELGSTVKPADNGEEKEANKIDGNGGATGSFKSAAAKELLKLADELDALADASLSRFDRFLAKAARASQNPAVKTAAEGMDDQDLAAASADNLGGQLEGGQMSDEEAAAILQEAIQSGAISEEELAAAVAELQGGASAAPAAPAAAEPAAPDESAAHEAAEGEAPTAPEVADSMPIDNAEAKLAAAHIDVNSPDYLQKITSLYPAEVAAGAKFAEALLETVTNKPAAKTAAEAAPKVEETKVAASLEPKTEDEKKALAAVQQELGLSDDQMHSIISAKEKPLSKEAAAQAHYRALLLTKIASLA